MRRFQIRRPTGRSWTPEPPADPREPRGECGCSVMELGSAQIYNEEAFQYFLAHERKRSRLSRCSFLLLLVDADPASPHAGAIPMERVRAIFTRLSGCLRETDILGWYRQGRVVGAVLTCAMLPISAETQGRIASRVEAVLRQTAVNRAVDPIRVRLFVDPGLTLSVAVRS